MLRNLRTRLNKLAGHRESEAVLQALAVIEETGQAPPGAAGTRAHALWTEALSRGFAPGPEAGLWCHLRATGKSVAEVMAEEAHGDS